MLFKDYYQLLGISPSASKQEIKTAYRSQCFKWHPDKNPEVDVTSMMQDINEAYKILNDDISRARYDYEATDDDLRNDINEARKYAKDLVDEFFRNLKETSKVAAKGAWDGAYGYIIGGIIATIIFALIKACH